MTATLDPGTRADLDKQVRSLSDEIAELRGLSEAFERWHQDMIGLTSSNRSLHGKGEDLVGIARSLIMVSLNAAIEAARAGDSARGFVAVASEVRSLAVKAQELANELRAGLNKNSMLTVSTFQDIQAGGKLMIAAVSGLGASVNTLRTRIE